jgi:serine protease AprX
MTTTLLLTVQSDEDDAAIRETGVEVLARYPDAMLVRGTGDQAQSLDRLGLESTALADRPVRTAGNAFTFADAVRAQEVVAVEPPPGRPSYYLLRLAGPPAPEWLRELRASGAQIHDSLSGFTLLIGVLPEHVADLRERPWVEDIAPYRPAMKISPRLRTGARTDLGVAELAVVARNETGDPPRLVEMSVFPGESIQDVAAQIRGTGGTVMSATGRTLLARVHPETLVELAGMHGVQAILPYSFPVPHNDRARAVLGVPPDNSFAGNTLTGAGQIVAIADTGLDTGDPGTVHPDVRGRVAGIVSWPTASRLARLVNDGPESDDGPADGDSGHGTHVTGSVLGSGRAALTAGSTPVPTGVAPEADVYFQAIGQRVHWKTAEELTAMGDDPGSDWPPPATGLYGLPDDLSRLFQEAYVAGARVHTNSWGSPRSAGEYSADARAVDEFTWSHPDLLLVFSAGNDGTDTDSDGVIDTGSVSSPGTAKNCLTVGAGENDRPAGSVPAPGVDRRWDQWKGPDGTLRWPRLSAAGHVSDNADGMAAFSSRGPARPDRIKPDVVAPGTNVLSTLSSVIPDDVNPLWGRLPAGHPLRGSYCWSGGTSMAAPLVAGAAALVRQHLIRDLGQRLPSSAVVKAFLVNGAVPMAGQFDGEVPRGCNQVCGFGRVDVASAVAALPSLFADEPEDAVMTGESRLYRIEPGGPSAPLTVTLVWTDAPSGAGHGRLVNELYLSVQAPDGTWTAGDPGTFPHPENNVQRVVVPAPAEGAHLVRVYGTSVIEHAARPTFAGAARQDFAIVAAGGASLVRIR